MGLAMVTPTRKKSGQWVTRKAIPAAVRAAYGKSEEIKWWPATLTEGQVKAECAAWLAPIEDRIAYLKSQQGAAPLSLTKRQCAALAGEWYQAKAAAEESSYTDSNVAWDWDGEIDAILPYGGDDGLEDQPLRPIQTIVEARDALLRERQLAVTPDSAERLLQEMLARYLDFLRLMQRRHAGDFGPDPVLDMLPEGDAFAPVKTKETPAVSIAGLFESYAATGAATPHTIGKWRAIINKLIVHLGHDDATNVTREALHGWFQALIGAGLSVKTVTSSYRAAVARVFAVAVNSGQLTANPADGIEVIGPKRQQTKRKSLSDDEAGTILRAALRAQPKGTSAHYARAVRWVPWICAYTGARVNEITQLRAMDIRQEDGVWVFHITPEAGSVKTGKARSVPVHSHLIDQGVLALAKAEDATPLFYDPSGRRGGKDAHPLPSQVGSKLAKWVRGLGVTEVEQPNHGWRHRFKTVARTAGIDAEARDAIQGHAPKTEGQAYGEWPPVALRAEIEKLPRYLTT